VATSPAKNRAPGPSPPEPASPAAWTVVRDRGSVVAVVAVVAVVRIALGVGPGRAMRAGRCGGGWNRRPAVRSSRAEGEDRRAVDVEAVPRQMDAHRRRLGGVGASPARRRRGGVGAVPARCRRGVGAVVSARCRRGAGAVVSARRAEAAPRCAGGRAVHVRAKPKRRWTSMRRRWSANGARRWRRRAARRAGRRHLVARGSHLPTEIPAPWRPWPGVEHPTQPEGMLRRQPGRAQAGTESHVGPR